MDKTYFNRKKPKPIKTDKSIFVNQAGYLTDGEKRAVITKPCASFTIEDTNGNTRFVGTVSHRGYDSSSGDDVYEADFSGFSEQGIFRIKANDEYSPRFEISDSVYLQPFDDMTKAFYYLRCGCDLESRYAGEFAHPACHTEKAVLWEDKGKKECDRYDVSGGWHDAGDYGRYVTAAACTVAHLLYGYIMFPDVFEKQSLNLPESGSGIPDVLSECRYELEWLLKMQRSDGAVWHKCTTAHHAPFIMPQDDKAQLYLLPISSFATADLAAVCALAARVYKPYDKDFSDRLTAAALKSYDWLNKNPQFVGFNNPDGCNTGCYGERTDEDNRFWAYCELYALTGEEKFRTLIKENYKKVPLAELGYGCISGLGSLCCLLNEKAADKEITDKMREEFAKAARHYKTYSDSCGYKVAITERQYCWGSNMNVMKNAMTYIICDYFNCDSDTNYRDYVNYQADYLLGLGATGYSYVTGCGELCCNYPHLRPAHADGIDKCMPGFVSGGANAHPDDTDAKILIPEGTPPMKCYADDVGCYSLNEVAIYWNSPAVFVFAYLNSIK